MPDLEDTTDLLNTCIFSGVYNDEDVGAEADLNNLETTMNVSPIPITRIHKDHPKEQIIWDPLSAPQTRRMTKSSQEHVMVSYIKNQRRTNHKDYHKCLFACFLSQIEPKKVTQALTDPSWIEAMQDELLQFRLQKVWRLVDLPKGKHAIRTKWVYKNKKDKRGIVYVDDIIFGSTKKSLCVEFEQMMHKRFQMSSMGELTFFLGLQVKQKDDGIFISQDKYVADILKKFDFVTVKTTSTPIETNKALLKDEEAEDVDVHLYRSMIGSLMYLTAFRPDIMFAVCACARDSPFDLEAFSDSDYAGASLDRKSTTGGCQFLGKRLISWQFKKQTIVANSTTKAEYVAAANCCGQVLWIQNQMLDYGFNFMNTKIHIDNESTICIVKNPVFHSKTKHIEIRHHFIRDSYEKRLIQVIKIHTDHNVADLLTKAFDVSSDEFGVQTGSCKVTSAWPDLVLLGEIDGKTVVISELLVRSDLHFNDEDGITCLTNETIFENHALMGISLVEPFNDIYKTHVHTKKVFTNMKRKGKDFSGRITPLFASMLAPLVVEGEGSGQPTEPQPAPSTTQPIIEEQIPITESSSPQNTQTSRQALQEDTQLPQTSVPIPNVADEAVFKEWDDRVVRATTIAGSLDVAQASGVNTLGSDEERIEHQELTDNILPTPYDLPLSGGYTPGSDEGRPDLHELMAICTKLSNGVLDLEKEKDAQAVEILNLKNIIKKLERKAKSSIPPPKKRLYKQVDSSDDRCGGTEVFDDTNAAKKDVNAVEPVSTIGDAVTAASVIPGIDTAGPLNVSVAGPFTSTVGNIFEDEMMTIADILVAIKSTRPRTTSVVIRDVEEELRRATPAPIVESQDKEFDNVQARMETDALLAARLQEEEREQFSIDEQARFLVETIAERKRFFTAQRAEQIRNKPPTKTQLRNKMITYLKNMEGGKNAESSKKEAASNKKIQYADPDDENVKRQKLEDIA
ncbi:putative ribonuclease H-like domain-containing protein [Tanacetum coccineum]